MIDLTEIKKLSDEEKLKVIDEIWASIDVNGMQEEDERVNETLLQEMEKRYHEVRTGKMQTIPWEEAEKILLMQIEKRSVKHA